MLLVAHCVLSSFPFSDKPDREQLLCGDDPHEPGAGGDEAAPQATGGRASKLWTWGRSVLVELLLDVAKLMAAHLRPTLQGAGHQLWTRPLAMIQPGILCMWGFWHRGVEGDFKVAHFLFLLWLWWQYWFRIGFGLSGSV